MLCLVFGVAAAAGVPSHGSDVLQPSSTASTGPQGSSTTQRPPCSEYFLGFSTGHVGSTTLCDESSYDNGVRDLRRMGFFYERSPVAIRNASDLHDEAEPNVPGCRDRVLLKTRYFEGMSDADEADHVRQGYLPSLANGFTQMFANATRSFLIDTDRETEMGSTYYVADPPSNVSAKDCTGAGCACVDLSHSNLFFIDGLLEELLDTAAVTLLRIRRPAIETARSFMGTTLTLNDTTAIPPASYLVDERGCGIGFKYYYCAMAGNASGARVVLKVDEPTWRNFSLFQRFLWSVDEVEAQWQRILARYAGRAISFAQVQYSSAGNDFESATLLPTARLMGLSPSSAVTDHQHHLTHSADEEAEYAVYEEQAREYVRSMTENCKAFDFARSMLNVAAWNQSGPVLLTA